MSEGAGTSAQSIGFAGLVHLATELPAAPAVPRSVPVVESVTSGASMVRPSSKGGTTKRSGWAYSIAGVVVLLGVQAVVQIVNTGSRNTTATKISAGYGNRQNQSSSYPATSGAVNGTQGYASSSPSYAAPAIVKPNGTPNQVFSKPEIRYCLTEYIRLDAIKEAVNTASSSQVTRYNGLIADYNLRCSHYRYSANDYDAATREVEWDRNKIMSEALSGVYSWQ